MSPVSVDCVSPVVDLDSISVDPVGLFVSD